MQLRCILIDDEFHALANLERLIGAQCPLLEVCGTAGSLEEGEELAATVRPDIIFLDIKMPGGNTIDRISPAFFAGALVVFVTAYDEFVLRAIKLGAFDYILKPVDPGELAQTMERVQAHYQAIKNQGGGVYHSSLEATMKQAAVQQTRRVLGVYANSQYCQLQFADIMTLEAAGAYTRIYTATNKVYMVSRNIGHFEELLEMENFFRVHKSFIVNLDAISTVDKSMRTVKLNNNLTIPVSQRVMPQFLNRLSQ